MTSGDKRTTTPVEPECAVLMLCLSSLSKRKKLLEIKGAVAGPKGGFILCSSTLFVDVVRRPGGREKEKIESKKLMSAKSDQERCTPTRTTHSYVLCGSNCEH